MLTEKKQLTSKPSYRHPPLKLTIFTAWAESSGGSDLDSGTQHEPASTERNNKKNRASHKHAEVKQKKGSVLWGPSSPFVGTLQ